MAKCEEMAHKNISGSSREGERQLNFASCIDAHVRGCGHKIESKQNMFWQFQCQTLCHRIYCGFEIAQKTGESVTCQYFAQCLPFEREYSLH